MHEEFTSAGWLNVEIMRRFIIVNMRVDQHRFALINATVTIFEIRPTIAQGFHLTTSQHNPRLIRLLDMVIEPSSAVDSDSFFTCLLFGHETALGFQLFACKLI